MTSSRRAEAMCKAVMQSRGSILQASRVRKSSLNILCPQQATLLDNRFRCRWPDSIVLTAFQRLHPEYRPSLQLHKAAVQLSRVGST